MGAYISDGAVSRQAYFSKRLRKNSLFLITLSQWWVGSYISAELMLQWAVISSFNDSLGLCELIGSSMHFVGG